MAKEQYMDLLADILMETDWKYGTIETDGDEYNEYVFIYQNYGNKLSELNELCKRKLNDANIDTYPDYDREDYYIDFITGDNWGYEDSYYICSNCGKAYRYEEYGVNEYWVSDSFTFCKDCVKEEYKETYIEEYLVNEPTHANVILGINELEDMGFEKANEYEYENGWYGTTDCPAEIYDKLKKEYPNSDIIFTICNSNPFAVYFDCYIRKADEDIDGDRYIDTDTGEVFSFEQMEQYCKENYDYGDETNFVTYMSEWWKEYGFKKIA